MPDGAGDKEIIESIALRDDGRAPLAETDSADPVDYDNYFRIDRRGVEAGDWWAGAQYVISQVLADLDSTGLDAELRRQLLAGVSRLLLASATTVTPSTAPASPTGAESPDALAARRWKLGHHLFHHLLSLMNSRMDQLSGALNRTDWDQVLEGLDELTTLYDAATATMHYASDFPRRAYEDTIRPSMEPPWMPPGFSGVFNQEHVTMLRQLDSLKPALRGVYVLRRLPVSVAKSAQSLWKSQSRNRREHKMICEKFVPGGESLLQQHFDDTEKVVG